MSHHDRPSRTGSGDGEAAGASPHPDVRRRFGDDDARPA